MNIIATQKVVYEEKTSQVSVPVGSHGSSKLIDIVRELDKAKIDVAKPIPVCNPPNIVS